MAESAIANTPPDARSAAPGAYGEYRSAGTLLRQIWQVLRRNLWLMLAIILAALAIGLVATMLQTPRYTADASVQINDQSDQVLGDEIGSTQDNAPIWDIERFLNTQLEIFESRALAARVSRRLKLAESDRFFSAMEAGETWQGAGPNMRRETVLSLLQSNLAIDLPENSRVARIAFTSADAGLSAEIANAYAEEAIQMTLQSRFDSSAYARDFVSEELEEARERLESSERELNAYARQAGLIRPRGAIGGSSASDGGASVTTDSLTQLNEAANRAQAERIAAESRWQAEAGRPALASQAVLSNPTVQNLMTRRAELQTELRAARERYLDDHPTVQNLEAQLSTVESELNRSARGVRDSIRSQFIAARDAERKLRQRVSQLRGDTLAEQDRSVRYNTLAREADINRTLYQGLLERYRELNASAGIAASNIAIIDEAKVPASPSSPNLARNLIISLLAGLGLAGLAAFLRDQLDDSVRTPEELESKVQLPLLGAIPIAAAGDPMAELAENGSPISEAYSSLLQPLLHSTRDGLPKVLLVTSSQPTEGKSVTSYATANAIARLGKRVVLIDADLRRPSVHRNAGIANKYGLSSLLSSNDPIEQGIQKAEQDNLFLIPSGPIPPSPTELLGGPKMAALLEDLAGSFDSVIIDSSPVLGLADAPALASLADGVMFVVEANRGRSGALKSALRRLRATNANIVGAVLTKFDPRRAGNSASAYSGYEYYRYGSERSEQASG